MTIIRLLAPLPASPDLFLTDDRTNAAHRSEMPDSASVDAAPDSTAAPKESTLPLPGSDDFPEIFIRLGSRSIGACELTAFKRFNTIYLPLSGIFRFVQLDITLSTDRTSATGFFIDPGIRYECDFVNGTITFDGEEHSLTATDFVIGETDVFLADNVLSEIFGLHCTFDEMNMYVLLSSERKMPALRAREREIARRYLDTYTGNVSYVDKSISRTPHLLNGGVVDWALSYNQTFPQSGITGYSAGFGGEIAGGDFSAQIYGSSQTNINWNSMPWHWRYVNQDWSAVKQISIGSIATKTPEMYYSLRGVQITNVPYTNRRGFSEHVIDDYTFPGWEVELYLNDKLIDYQRTDSTGRFHFALPISYGTTNITLKYFGPHGEERIDRRRLDIPFFLLPQGEFEYTASAGRLTGYQQEAFAQISNRYGVTPYLTAGGGMQYSGRAATPTYIPFGFATLRMPNNTLLNGEYLHKQWSRGVLQFVSNDMPDIQLSYTQYDTDPTYNILGIRHESRISALISTPRTWFTNGISFGMQEIAYNNRSYVYGNASMSCYFGRLFTTLSARAGWAGETMFRKQTYIESSLNAYYTLPLGIFFSGSLDYDVADRSMKSIRVAMSRKLFNALDIGFSYSHLLNARQTTAQLTITYDLDFTRVQTQAMSSYGRSILQSNMRGTVAFDPETQSVIPGNRTGIDRSGLNIVPFYDANNNDIFDEGEPVLEQPTNARLSGLSRRTFEEGAFTRFSDLLPYQTYRLSIDQNTFDDPLYATQYKTYAVTADPNQYKTLYLPVFVAGSVEGNVLRETTLGTVPQSGVKVYFEHQQTRHVYETVTFSDGSLFLFGLRPGKYHASLDTTQLDRLSMKYEPKEIEFEVKALPEGDAVTGIRFILMPPDKMALVAPADALDVNDPVTRFVLTDEDEHVKELTNDAPRHSRTRTPIPLYEWNTLLIDLDSKIFSSVDASYLNDIAASIKIDPSIIAVVQGHSDNFGTFTENQLRSEQRAEIVKRYLIAAGVSEHSIYTRGLGSRRPVARNTTPENRRKNNRVDIQLISTESPVDESPMMSIRGLRQ